MVTAKPSIFSLTPVTGVSLSGIFNLSGVQNRKCFIVTQKLGVLSLFFSQRSFTNVDRRPHSLSSVSLERTGRASYFWAGVTEPCIDQFKYLLHTDTASLETVLTARCCFFAHVQWKSTRTAMRSFAVFLICFYSVGFIGCKPSSPCPRGQFMLKNQCVLCHPTCSECLGHELFECTTCGVGE